MQLIGRRTNNFANLPSDLHAPIARLDSVLCRAREVVEIYSKKRRKIFSLLNPFYSVSYPFTELTGQITANLQLIQVKILDFISHIISVYTLVKCSLTFLYIKI